MPDQPSRGNTESLPLFPLGTVLVPEMQLSLHVFEPRYRQLVADLLGGAESQVPEFGVVAVRQGWEVGPLGDLHEVGTTALISDVLPLADGRCNLSAIGRRRFVIRSVDSTAHPYLVAQVEYLPETLGAVVPEATAGLRRVSQLHAAALAELGIPGTDEFVLPAHARELSYAIARQPGLTLIDRQAILAAETVSSRIAVGTNILRREYQLTVKLHAVPITAANFTLGSTPAG